MAIENIKKILIIAPFWGRVDHVGCHRIEKFIRWLNAEGVEMILVKADNDNTIEQRSWGIEISIKDQVGIILQKINTIAININLKLVLIFLKIIRLILSPLDEYYSFSKKVTKNDFIRSNINGVNLIISSSPPHSSHLAAFKLSKKYSIPTVVDLRDGWLDEPLQKSVDKFRVRNYFEQKLEKKILSNSKVIFVTSKLWKTRLDNRLQFARDKTFVLTNGYLLDRYKTHDRNARDKSCINLLYTGRFTKSIYTRNPGLLLEPLYNYLSKNKIRVNIDLLSDLNNQDQYEIDNWRKKFILNNNKLLIRGQLEKNKMYNKLFESDGLLVLSAGICSIPLKLFDYIKSAKPILAVTLDGSAVWQMGKNIPQMFLYDYTENSNNYSPISKFLEACKSGNYKFNVPIEYSDNYLSRIFLDTIRKIKN
jgi:glycosyltransferase involved in cell wall biosynthesis